MIIESKDGKIERVEGNEPLIKEPRKKNLLKDRWKNIKKNLDNNESILDLSNLSNQDSDDQESEKSNKQPVQEQPSEEQDSKVEQQSNDEQPSDEGSNQQPDAAPEEQMTALQHDLHHESEIKNSLKEHGYSDVEIAYILHGHDFTMHGLEGQQEQEDSGGNDFNEEDEVNNPSDSEESNHKTEHEKRMLDLEYSHRQRQLQLEMHLKEQEIQHKLEKLKNQNK